MDLRLKLQALEAQLRAHAPLVIAYSGGVDSAYLLAQAHRWLGANALGVIADSPSLPRQALADALALAAALGAHVEVVETQEMENADRHRLDAAGAVRGLHPRLSAKRAGVSNVRL